MTEESLKSDIQTIISKYVTNFTLEIIKRDINTASSMIVQVGVILQDGVITQQLIADLLEYRVQNDYNNVSFKTQRDLGDMSVEAITIEAEIYYL